MVLVAAGILIQNSSVLICQRKPTDCYPLLWEFPGGKAEAGETPESCLCRELMEELSIDAVIGKEFHRHDWIYPDAGSFRVIYFFVESFSGIVTNNVFEQICWTPIKELLSVEMLTGNVDVSKKLIKSNIAS